MKLQESNNNSLDLARRSKLRLFVSKCARGHATISLAYLSFWHLVPSATDLSSISYHSFTLDYIAISVAISSSVLWLLTRVIISQASKAQNNKQRLTKAPGMRLLAIVDFLFRPATVKLTFKQLIADWRTEYFEALSQGRTMKARWVMIRYRFYFACTFIRAMGLSNVLSFFKQLSK